uniref:C-type lectin domain-containing protein n=1 Tax=Poecilia reticulata TaxID=8081 RepID=A0A3P9NLU0_POERE
MGEAEHFHKISQRCFMDCQLYEFHYINENKSWTEAQQYCREKHTDLVTVTNMKDMERLIGNSPGNMKEAWIGLYDQTHGTRKWFWSLPGVEFDESETNWNHGEPNDAGTENCGIVWKHLQWGDVSCNSPTQFICYDGNDLFEEAKTWLEAQSYCREKHTDLISGTKQLQDDELKKMLESKENHQYMFMGLIRDTWRWSDGSSFSFRHWNKKFDDEQNNSGQCAVTVFSDGGRWRNENCDEKKPFICYDDKVILISEKMNWLDALTYCRGHHHDLVTITTMDDQRWIQEKVKNASTYFVWLGLRFNCKLKFWSWVCREAIGYRTQTSGQTDGCNVSGAMETGGRHMWFQRNGGEEHNFICSKI